MSAPVRFGIVDHTDPEKALAQIQALDSDGDGVPNSRDKEPGNPRVSAHTTGGVVDLDGYRHSSEYVQRLAKQAATFNTTPNKPVKPVNEWDKDVMHAVTKDGGFTFHDAIGDGPSDGFMVSVAKHNEVKMPVRGLTSAHIADYMSTHQQELKDPANYLGGWVYKGNVYLDISRHVPDREQAMKLARANNQLGIYDIGKGETLMTEPEQQEQKAAFVVGRNPDPDVFLSAIQRAAVVVLASNPLVDAVKRYALEHYTDGGWDVIVECYDDEMIANLIEGATTPEEAVAMADNVVQVYADRQADARNSAF